MQNRPSNAAPAKNQWLQEKQNPNQNLPKQKPITDEEEIDLAPAKWKTVVRRILFVVVMALVIAFVYIFLLLGEPEDEAQKLEAVPEERIVHSISPLEVPGESDATGLAQTFGQPVLSLYPGVLPMERSRIYDTAFEGDFARRVTLTYTLPSGEQLLVESIRPTSAISLMGGEGFHLDGQRAYAIGGVDAAWMDNGQIIRVFGQTENAAYCVTAPYSCKEELPQLIRSTILTAPAAQE